MKLLYPTEFEESIICGLCSKIRWCDIIWYIITREIFPIFKLTNKIQDIFKGKRKYRYVPCPICMFLKPKKIRKCFDINNIDECSVYKEIPRLNKD